MRGRLIEKASASTNKPYKCFIYIYLILHTKRTNPRKQCWAGKSNSADIPPSLNQKLNMRSKVCITSTEANSHKLFYNALKVPFSQFWYALGWSFFHWESILAQRTRLIMCWKDLLFSLYSRKQSFCKLLSLGKIISIKTNKQTTTRTKSPRLFSAASSANSVHIHILSLHVTSETQNRI